jgi:hypothetical protein
MTKRKRMTWKQVRRLEAALPATLRFIQENIPEEVRQTKTDQFNRYSAVMSLPTDTVEGVNMRAIALLWAVDFVSQNYGGRVEGKVAKGFGAAVVLLVSWVSWRRKSVYLALRHGSSEGGPHDRGRHERCFRNGNHRSI